jgi:hypothetical protein
MTLVRLPTPEPHKLTSNTPACRLGGLHDCGRKTTDRVADHIGRALLAFGASEHLRNFRFGPTS